MSVINYETTWDGVFVWERQALRPFPLHLHDYMEIIWLQSGKSTCTVDFMPYTLTAGDLLIVFPNRIHSYGNFTSDTANFALLFPRTLPFLDGLLTGFVPKCPVLHGCVTPAVESLLRAARTAYAKGGPYAKSEALGYIQALLASLLPKLDLVPVDTLPSGTERRLIEYCAARYTDRLTLADVADALGYSPTYISHIFSEKFGIGFADFLAALRVEDAKKRLRGEDSITTIAYDAGFGGVRSFNRVFKAQTGKTPTAYRAAHRKK